MNEVENITKMAQELGLYDPSQGSAFGTVDGYESLELILSMAYQQAACGKGKERHASGRPFHDQPMQRESDDLGHCGGLVYQVRKKTREGMAMPENERKIKELLGAINYLAGTVIWLLRHDERPISTVNSEDTITGVGLNPISATTLELRR